MSATINAFREKKPQKTKDSSVNRLPVLAIKDARPTVFKLIVLPPVLGPVITSTLVFSEIIKST